MIGKPIKGKSFRGCVRYAVNKQGAEILEAEGISMQDAASITRDFNFQRKLNPALGKAVGHTVLSWSALDKDKLTDGLMVEIAGKYMKEMGITDTQYLVVKHQDKEHPHVHIIFNRVDNNGKTITDKNDYARNAKVCRQLTEAYGLHVAEGKDRVNRQQLKGSDKLKYEIHDALKQALLGASSWQQLEERLQQKGIAIKYKYKSGTDEVQGVSFEKAGLVFKGSAIDRSMSVAGIEKLLRMNGAARRKSMQTDTTRSGRAITLPAPELPVTGIKLTPALTGLLGDLLKPAPADDPYDVTTPQHKKRKRGRGR